MKGFIVSSLAVFSLTALTACAPYNWEKDYGNGVVGLDGPLRKNVSYVKGSTSFAGPAQAGFAAPAQAASFAAPGFAAPSFASPSIQTQSIIAPNLGVLSNVARSFEAPAVTPSSVSTGSGFIAPITAAPSIPSARFPQTNVTFTAPTQPVREVRVPPAFINAGQSANLQTRRVGDAGIVVFSDMIEESVAKAAASRSCVQEGKAATPTDAVSVATGVKQLNFSCS